MKLKKNFFWLVFVSLFFSTNTDAKNEKKSKTSPNKATTYPAVPKLQNDEYAVFINDKYRIFKTKTYEELELDSSCFKNSIPNCEAYKLSQLKTKGPVLKHESMNNFAAVHCADINGKNLIALDKDRNEYNFCLFKDGSMVNAWSMYLKHNPVPVIKATE